MATVVLTFELIPNYTLKSNVYLSFYEYKTEWEIGLNKVVRSLFFFF